MDLIDDFHDPLVRLIMDTKLAAWSDGALQMGRLYQSERDQPTTIPKRSGDKAPPGGESASSVKPLPWEWEGMKVWQPVVEEASKVLTEKNLVSRAQFRRLSEVAKVDALTVANVRSQKTLEKVRETLDEAITQGDSFAETVKKLDDRLDTSPLSPGQMENVYRTNIASAFSRGLDAVLANPIVDEQFPYEAVMVIDDTNLTDLCRIVAKSGIQGTNIYRRDDPTYRHFLGPRHWKCRCSRRPMTIQEAADAGIQEAKIWLKTKTAPTRPAWVEWPNDPDGNPLALPKGWVGNGPVNMSIQHAPEGGVTIGGQFFKGGEFIPGEVLEKATPEEKQKLGESPTKANPEEKAQSSDWGVLKSYSKPMTDSPEFVYRTEHAHESYKGKTVFGSGLYLGLRKDQVLDMTLDPHSPIMQKPNEASVKVFSFPKNLKVLEIDLDDDRGRELIFRHKLTGQRLKAAVLAGGYDAVRIKTDDLDYGGDQIVVYRNQGETKNITLTPPPITGGHQNG